MDMKSANDEDDAKKRNKHICNNLRCILICKRKSILLLFTIQLFNSVYEKRLFKDRTIKIINKRLFILFS